MRELKLMSLHTDGNHVVLGDAEGDTYLLKIDEPLRDSVRRDRTFRSKSLPIAVPRDASEAVKPFSPREVQDRIRSGHSPEAIVETLGYDLEKVLRFAPPVQAERERNARLARSFAASRAGSPPLEKVVTERLTSSGITELPLWDAWKREDGWVLQLQFTTPEENAEAIWHCDFESHTLSPENEAAVWFSDPAAETESRIFRRRLAAVRNWIYDGEDSAQSGQSPLNGHIDTAPVRVQMPQDQAARERLLSELEASRGVRPDGTGPLTVSPTELPVNLPHSLAPKTGAITAPSSGTTATPIHGAHSGAKSGAKSDTTATDGASQSAGSRAKNNQFSLGNTGVQETSAPQKDTNLQNTIALTVVDAKREVPLTPGNGKTVEFSADNPATHPEVTLGAEDFTPTSSKSEGGHYEVVTDTGTIEVANTETGAQRIRKRRTTRSSVPSWDDIIFGTKGSKNSKE